MENGERHFVQQGVVTMRFIGVNFLATNGEVVNSLHGDDNRGGIACP